MRIETGTRDTCFALSVTSNRLWNDLLGNSLFKTHIHHKPFIAFLVEKNVIMLSFKYGTECVCGTVKGFNWTGCPNMVGNGQFSCIRYVFRHFSHLYCFKYLK
uniref:Uncharacterized protein n=1 Tax=Cacopsylla melanoneura TaxID=428564 RepID=A0A8D8TLN6_9HEMI